MEAGRSLVVDEVDVGDVGEARGVGSPCERAFYYFTCRSVYRDVWPLRLRFILHFPSSTRLTPERASERARLRFISLIPGVGRRHMALKESLVDTHSAGVNYVQLVACILVSPPAGTARSPK